MRNCHIPLYIIAAFYPLKCLNYYYLLCRIYKFIDLQIINYVIQCKHLKFYNLKERRLSMKHKVLKGNKSERIKDLTFYMLYRIQIILLLLVILFTYLSAGVLFFMSIITMGIMVFYSKDAINFFRILATVIIEWKYKDGNYRDSIISGNKYNLPEEWTALFLILDYIMIAILGQSK